MKHIVILFLLGFALSAEAADPATSGNISDIGRNGSDCIWMRTVRDYTPLDDRNLILWGPGKRGYLVTLLYRSFDLRSSMGLGFSSRDDQLCPYGGDEIVVNGLSREAIGIRSIAELDAQQVEQVMIRFGKKEPNEQQTPAGHDVKGAEVEELD
jgi:Family of unknown function (DUF6491)